MQAFDISTKSRGEITLDADGKARIELLVSNRLGRKVHAHIRLEPSGEDAQAADSAWLRLDTEEREFDPDASSSVMVDVDVPEGTPAGRYAFRVFVGADTDHPDRDFARSEPIALRYTAQKQFPWMWVLLAAGLVVVAAGGGLLYWWMTRTPECEVERARYDEARGRCVCPDHSSEETVAGVRRCVCDPGRKYDPRKGECLPSTCTTEYALYDERQGGCRCPAGTREADVASGGKRCVCDGPNAYNPAAGKCVSKPCRRRFAVYDDVAGACVCPPGTSEKTVGNQPVCACPSGQRYDPTSKRCVAMADLAIDRIDVNRSGGAFSMPRFQIRIRVRNLGGGTSGKYQLTARQRRGAASNVVKSWPSLGPIPAGGSTDQAFEFRATLLSSELEVFLKPFDSDNDASDANNRKVERLR